MKDTKVFALGGLGEVGKNMYCVMHENEIIIIDAGVTFPDDVVGIDYVIPDFTFLKKNERKIKALFITHGHEDHIGAIPFLVQNVNIPEIYAPNQAIGLIKKKFEERSIDYKNLYAYNEQSIIKFKNLTVEFFMTTHSIPDSHGILVRTPNGTIVETGDFKFDFTPIGPMANIHKMARIGEEGVTLLMSESTNALNPGISTSESKVDEALKEVFKKHNSRIIIATFASNIYRLKHIVDTCKMMDRKIAIFGRSMNNNIEISIEGGYIKNKEIFITPEEANTMPDNKVCLLCTGSQGEPLAALSRIANGTHKQIKLKSDDVVVFSSSAIPGNQVSISRTINKLYLKGVKVYTNTSLSDVHTSGHANEEELKLMIRLMKPKYVMPIHGEYRMLRKHADIAIMCNVAKENTFVLSNGDVLSMNNGVINKTESIHAADAYVDGNRVGDVDNTIMRERKIMSQDGIVIITITMSKNKLITTPSINTRGFVLVNDNTDLIHEFENKSKYFITNKLKNNISINEIKLGLIQEISNLANEKTGRRPIVLPVIMEIDK